MEETSIEIPEQLIQSILEAKNVTLLTGAGISVESGIPTFRDSRTGLWNQYKPQDLATPKAFLENPALVWQWYEWRKKLIDSSSPNPGHCSIVELEKHFTNFWLITQNIDGLHQAAGSQDVIELHGNIHRARCIKENKLVDHWDFENEIPICPDCKAPVRPDVVWFGESLNPASIQKAVYASQNCDLFFSVGTSGIVEPAASLPFEALRHGAKVIEINPQPTPLTIYATYYFSHSAATFLPALIQKVWRDC